MNFLKRKDEYFFDDVVRKIFSEKKKIIDIGGGLRIDKLKNNRFDGSHGWILPLTKNVEYLIMDPVDTFHPDILGDIHNMPFIDGSIDAIFCLAVFEHIENPFKATSEIYRVLKDDGFAFLYLPFLYYYHAEKGYYKDYWRFTEDSIRLMFKDFSSIEVVSVRGRFETWIRLSPLGGYKFFVFLFRVIDLIFKKDSKQVGGYNVFLKK